MRRILALLVASAALLSACAAFGGDPARTHKAMFSRAVQLFPGGNVRVLGVDVGEIIDVRNVADGVEVTFSIEDPEIRLPADVQAAIVPASLLGERYVQLFPAYQGGPVLEPGAVIPMDRTAIPAEPDELLRSLQDYLGAIDPATVTAFVENAAEVLRGAGDDLNGLIEHGTGVLATLSAKRDDLAEIVVQFDRLARALSTRQEGLASLIHSYNAVAGTLVDNRAAVEGSILGLSEMSAELAALLVDHRRPLHRDIKMLTRTGRTLTRNVDALARTGHWATRLFAAASRAVDYDRNWLRLNNQGHELGAMIVMRLEERLMELCADLGLPFCSAPRYWEQEVPSLFCLDAGCPKPKPPSPEGGAEQVQQELVQAIQDVPELAEALLERARELTCADAADRVQCLKRKRILIRCANAQDPEACLERAAVKLACLRAADPGACLQQTTEEEMQELVDALLEETLGDPVGIGGGMGP